MEPQTAQMVYAELNTIKQTLQKLEHDIERLSVFVAADRRTFEPTDFLSLVDLGTSETSDVSENHDRYLGQAIADEHLH